MKDKFVFVGIETGMLVRVGAVPMEPVGGGANPAGAPVGALAGDAGDEPALPEVLPPACGEPIKFVAVDEGADPLCGTAAPEAPTGVSPAIGASGDPAERAASVKFCPRASTAACTGSC